jgi:hypothetical protein
MRMIGSNCFYDCVNLTKINPPSLLWLIGENVFHGCGKLENQEI